MAAFLHRPEPKTKLWLAFGLLLLSQLAGPLDLHTDHGAEPAFQPHAGELAFQEACHPQEAPHLEATGSGYPTHPCALCLHQVRSAGERRASAPRLAPPAPALAAAVISSCPRANEALCPWGSRAPPAA